MTKIGFLFRCMYRRKLRTTLTMLSLVTAFILFVLLRSVSVVFEGGVDLFSENRLQTVSKFSMIQLLPHSQLAVIESIEGVSKVTHASWFGGTFKEGETMDATFAIDPETYFDVYSNLRVDPQQLEEFKSLRTAALAPQSMADRHGWEVGQKIPVRSPIFPAVDASGWVFDLVGTYTADSGNDSFNPFVFHYEYLNENYDLGSVGWFTMTIDDIDRAAEISREIDSKFENSSNATRTATEAQHAIEFMSQYGDISLMMTGILSAVFFSMVLLTANTMAQGYRERVPELAVMKTLGFKDLKVATLVLSESLLICVISAAIGVLLGGLVTYGAQEFLPTNMLPVVLDPLSMLYGLLVALILGFVVGIVPSTSANRLSIVDALHAR